MPFTGRRIYFDYQASTPVDSRVTAAMLPYFSDHPGNPHATDHAYGWEADLAIKSATRQVASAIGADEDEIIFTSGATESNNLAILGVMARAPANRRRILVSAIEHKCVLAATRAAADRFGAIVEHLPVDSEGVLRPETVRDRMSDDVLIVSVMSVNNEIGSRQPVAELAVLCREAGALLHTDAAQALTAATVDVNDLDVDLLSISGHKIYGPKGVGALYIRREVQHCLEPLMYGGGQQHGLRAGTLPVPLCVGLGEAASLVASPSAGEERDSIRHLRDVFVEAVRRAIPCMRLNGPPLKARHPGNANMRFGTIDARDLLAALQPRVAASTSSACTSGLEESSYVLRAIGLSDLESRASVRFSLGRFTSLEETELAVNLIEEAWKKVRNQGLP